MTIPKTHHFLCIEQEGIHTYLSALPGQTIRGQELTPGIKVKGCDTYRKKFPVGTIFGTTTLKTIHKGFTEYYRVKDLFCLSVDEPSAKKQSDETRKKLIDEYKNFIGK